ncbi:unnamed protein product [Spirodela intermedia]|uniref:Uncharacterized protein n=1 Tax=Spirodela intermedia TaxID=51605 RepID=A0A7I8IA92_SPIIN|nr:unnamed protein product [Spirodela intermedia]CAA6654569.1 unnamed protein product [Spirodela intermedia]
MDFFNGEKKTDLKLAERTNTGATKFLVRFPSERIRSTFASIVKPHQLLSPLHEISQSGAAWTLGKGSGLRKLAQRFSGCLGIGKKRPIQSGGAAGAAVDVDEAVVNTILDAVDFAGLRKSPPLRGAADRLTEFTLERNLSINSAIAHCKMSYSGGSSLR